MAGGGILLLLEFGYFLGPLRVRNHGHAGSEQSRTLLGSKACGVAAASIEKCHGGIGMRQKLASRQNID